MAIAKPLPADVTALTGSGFPEPVVQAFIDDAVLIAEKCISAMPEARQKSVLKWLAAHLIASTDEGGVRTSESLGDASESFARAKMGDALKGTVYGQQAIALAPCLGRIGRATAVVTVV